MRLIMERAIPLDQPELHCSARRYDTGCCLINERCGQHSECFIALLTARKATRLAHSSLRPSEWIWTQCLTEAREVSC
jgi:hypothetical protein